MCVKRGCCSGACFESVLQDCCWFSLESLLLQETVKHIEPETVSLVEILTCLLKKLMISRPANLKCLLLLLVNSEYLWVDALSPTPTVSFT